jgi:hypothetical protein
MKKLSLLAIFLVVSCSSIPKTTIPNHNIQLTCEVGTRYFFINLQDVPKKSFLLDLVSDNAWYVMTQTTMPDFNQKPSITWGPADVNEKRFLQKPYSVTNDMLYFTTYGHTWEVNRINMQTILYGRINKNNVWVGTCEYGFQTEQFK